MRSALVGSVALEYGLVTVGTARAVAGHCTRLFHFVTHVKEWCCESTHQLRSGGAGREQKIQWIQWLAL